MSNAVIVKLNELGYITIPEAFYGKIAEWKSWYQGNVKGFHSYKVRNGESVVSCKRYSLNMAKKLCEDWANLLMNEKVQITLEGQKEQEFVNRILMENNFTVKANEMQEMAFAFGTVAYVPRVIGQEINEGGEIIPGNASGIMLDYVIAENIYPLSWANSHINECAFSSTVFVAGKNYLYLQIHRKDENGDYVIENRIYRNDNDMLADEQLTNVKGFENVQPVVHTGSNKRQFVIDRPNIANNFNFLLPTGISVYANAIDVLQGVDIAYDSYVNEFKLGKKRIIVKPSAAKYIDGEPAFDPDDVAFYVLPEDVSDGAVITPIDMQLRTTEHNTGIQDQLNILSSKCGFGETYYRFDGGSVATATQVISEHSTMFSTIRKHEIVLRQALVELCRVILRLGNTAMNAGLNENVAITVNFDDSIITDTESERAQDRQDVSMGAMSLVEYRMKWYGEDEATARKMLPKLQELVDEQQNEVE